MTERAPRWARAVLVLGLILIVVGGGGALAAQLVVDRWDRAVGKDELLAPQARQPAESAGETASSGPPTTPGQSPEPSAAPTPGPTPTAGTGDSRSGQSRRTAVTGPLTYLVIGTDSRGGGGGRADAIVIAHVTDDLRHAYLISIPRDLLVPIPGHWQDKINAAYQLGGAQLLSATLHDLTGIGFDGAAVLDFAGFREVIDAIGGVELCLDREIRSIHTGAVFPAGCQRLDGAQALDLARQRYDLPRGDLDRGVNHQRLIRAMIDQAASADLLTNPIKLDRTIRAVGDAVTVDTGGIPLPELAYALRQLRPSRIVGITLPSYPQNIDGISYVLADPAADGLYRAVRESKLADWAREHDQWRND
ncbi:MAG TPA: LCP family protein [Natronosporangium sp.]